MTTTTLFAIILISSALVCYSIGVWSARLVGKLKRWHLLFFWVGFVADAAGTTLMSTTAGGWAFNVHGITGMVALLLMLINAVWATMVIIRQDEKDRVKFPRFSVFVWAVWLIPFFTGFFLARGMG
jgi:uncharacterized repeat protein (TIGR03987 family)